MSTGKTKYRTRRKQGTEQGKPDKIEPSIIIYNNDNDKMLLFTTKKYNNKRTTIL